MSRPDWISLGFGVMFACVGISYMLSNMSRADRFAACEVRGGLMKEVAGEIQCVMGDGNEADS